MLTTFVSPSIAFATQTQYQAQENFQPVNDLSTFYSQLNNHPSIEEMYEMRNQLNKMRNDFDAGERKKFLGLDEGEVHQFSPQQISSMRNANSQPYDVLSSKLNARILRTQELENQRNNIELIRESSLGGNDLEMSNYSYADSWFNSSAETVDELISNNAGRKASSGATFFERRGLFRSSKKRLFLARTWTLMEFLRLYNLANAEEGGLRPGISTSLRFAARENNRGKLKYFEASDEFVLEELKRLRDVLASQ